MLIRNKQTNKRKKKTASSFPFFADSHVALRRIKMFCSPFTATKATYRTENGGEWQGGNTRGRGRENKGG